MLRGLVFRSSSRVLNDVLLAAPLLLILSIGDLAFSQRPLDGNLKRPLVLRFVSLSGPKLETRVVRVRTNVTVTLSDEEPLSFMFDAS